MGYYDYTSCYMSELVGKVFTSACAEGDSVILETDEYVYRLEHHQDCCENVYIESIVGDLSDLVGEEILLSEERDSSHMGPKSKYTESYTWTFYTLATRKGYVDIRFYGSSNGYYGESASLYRYNIE